MQYTQCQQNTLKVVDDWIKRPKKSDEDYLFTISGFAGTGKSTIVRDIIQGVRGVVVSAPTHKAKKIISDFTGRTGQTVQSLLGLRPNVDLADFNPNKPVFDKKAEETIKDYKLVVIDEAGMLNKDAFNLIKEKAAEYETMVLFVGDDYQLPPINEKISKVFRIKNISYLKELVRQDKNNPNYNLLVLARLDIRNATLLKGAEDIQKERKLKEKIELGIDLAEFILHKLSVDRYLYHIELAKAVLRNKSLTDINRLCKLIEQDKEFKEINNVIKYLKSTVHNVVDNKGFMLVNITEFTNKILELYSDSEYQYNPEKIKTMCYTNIETTKWYNSIRAKINNKKELIAEGDILTGYRTITRGIGRGAYELVLENSKDYIVESALLINDIFLGVELQGYKTKFKEEKRPRFILHPSSYGVFIEEYKKRLSIANTYRRWTQFNDFKNRIILSEDLISPYGKLIARKDIGYGHAITVHKSQGSTYSNSAINLKELRSNRDTVEKRKLIYVALSRSKGLNIIYNG